MDTIVTLKKFPAVSPQLNIKKEVTVSYSGIKRTSGDRDNMPTKEHEFIVIATGAAIRFKDIKLLQYAPIKKGQQYILGFDDEHLYLPISIIVGQALYYRETSNRIISVDSAGTRMNHSDNPTTKAMGQGLRAFNRKLKAEGKQPIKPIKRRW